MRAEYGSVEKDGSSDPMSTGWPTGWLCTAAQADPRGRKRWVSPNQRATVLATVDADRPGDPHRAAQERRRRRRDVLHRPTDSAARSASWSSDRIPAAAPTFPWLRAGGGRLAVVDAGLARERPAARGSRRRIPVEWTEPDLTTPAPHRIPSL